jgi:hypothetical protein
MNRNTNTEDWSLYEHFVASIHFLLNMKFGGSHEENIRN